MMIRWIGLTLVLGSMGACSPHMKHVDIDAGGYEPGPLTGRELMDAARNHAVHASWQVIGIEMLIHQADLPEAEKTRIRQRVDFLTTTFSESTVMTTTYLEPAFSEADRRQVFRAIQDRLDKANKELLEIRSSLSRAAKVEDGAGLNQE